MPFRSYRRLLF